MPSRVARIDQTLDITASPAHRTVFVTLLKSRSPKRSAAFDQRKTCHASRSCRLRGNPGVTSAAFVHHGARRSRHLTIELEHCRREPAMRSKHALDERPRLLPPGRAAFE